MGEAPWRDLRDCLSNAVSLVGTRRSTIMCNSPPAQYNVVGRSITPVALHHSSTGDNYGQQGSSSEVESWAVVQYVLPLEKYCCTAETE